MNLAIAKSKLVKLSFSPIIQVSDETLTNIFSHGEVINVKKNQVIKKAESKEKYLHFIIKGSGGVLLFHKNNSICIDLCFEGDYLGDFLSFLTGENSILEIICFEPSELLRLSFSDVCKLTENAGGKAVCQEVAESLFIRKQHQQISLLTKTAEQRYLDLLQKQPSVVQRTPDKYLASYLGVTPESFSRIKRKIFK